MPQQQEIPLMGAWFQEPKTMEQWLQSLVWVLRQDSEVEPPLIPLERAYEWAIQVALWQYDLKPYSEIHPLDLRPGMEEAFLREAEQQPPQWALDLVELQASLPTLRLPKEPQACARRVLMHLGEALEEMEPAQPD